MVNLEETNTFPTKGKHKARGKYKERYMKMWHS